MIDAKELEAIAEAVADSIVEIVEAMGLKPFKKAGEIAEGGAEGAVEGRLPDEAVLHLYDTMPQEFKDFLRGRHGDETWAAYEADIERMRGEQSA